MGQYIEVKEKATPIHGLELSSHPYPLVGWTHPFLLSYHSSLCCRYNPCYWCCLNVIIDIPGSAEIIRGATSSWREFCFLFSFISIRFIMPGEAAGGGILDCVLHLSSSCLGEHNGASEAPAIPQSIYHTRVQLELTVHHIHRNVKWGPFERTRKKDLDNTDWKWRSPTSSL